MSPAQLKEWKDDLASKKCAGCSGAVSKNVVRGIAGTDKLYCKDCFETLV